jgi:hypothetical protein
MGWVAAWKERRCLLRPAQHHVVFCKWQVVLWSLGRMEQKSGGFGGLA